MEIKLTDTDFGPFPNQSTAGLTLSNIIGGTSNGPVSAQGFLDPANQEFGIALTTGFRAPSGPGAFDDTVSSPVYLPADGQPFSLSETVTITHTGAGKVSSFSKVLEAGADSVCTGSIGDFVWHDLNKNGIQDAGEPGINGVTVNLLDDGGNVIATTVTATGPGGNDGFYEFSGLCAGEYKVVVDLTSPPLANLEPTPVCSDDQTIPDDSNADGSPGDCTPSQTVILPTDNTDNPTIDFGFIEPCVGSIGDYVWKDDGDGCQDLDKGIAGVEVCLYENADCVGGQSGTLVSCTTTDANGYYLFENLECGKDYEIKFTTPDGLTPTLPNAVCTGDPVPGDSDANDSDCEEGQRICVSLGQDTIVQDLTVDCGYVPVCDIDVEKFCSTPPVVADFICDDAKPIDSLTMVWDGSKNISQIAVYKDKYDSSEPNKNFLYTIPGPILPGDTVTADGYAAAGARNDVDWLITFADDSQGISRFHRSCSDEDMNGPEDCGKYQGNAKSTDPSFIKCLAIRRSGGQRVGSRLYA